MPGSRKSHSRVWVRRPGQHRLEEMSWADSLVTTGRWMSWRQVQPGLVTWNLSFHWGMVVECHGMVTSMLQVGKWMLTWHREATGSAEDRHIFGRSRSSHSCGCRHSDIHNHGCQIWWVLGTAVMYGTPLDLVDGASAFPGTPMGRSGQRCGEVIQTRRPAVSMCHLRKVTLIPGSPGRAITDMHPPGGLCARAGVRLGGGSPHRARPAVGHHRLGHQHDVGTGVRRCRSHKCSLVKKESGMASYSSSARQHGTLGGASKRKEIGCWQAYGARPSTSSCQNQGRSRITTRHWRMRWRCGSARWSTRHQRDGSLAIWDRKRERP